MNKTIPSSLREYGATLIPGLLIAFMISCSGGPGFQEPKKVEEGVRLMVDAEFLDPTTTFELRFDEAVIAPGEVGKIVSPSPLVIQPPLKGGFKWLSTRSGVFTPSEPASLGTTYRLTLRPGLKRADGQSLKVALDRSVRAPDFEVIRFSPQQFNTNNAPSQPSVRVRFNAEVAPEIAKKFVEFRDANGKRETAQVETGKAWARYSDYPDQYVHESTWKERFYEKRNDRNVRRTEEETDEGGEHQPIPSMLLVAPQSFLPVGKEWKLVVKPGLPSSEGRWVTRKPFELPVGNVEPFAVAKCQSDNVIGQGKSVVLHFSKRMDPDLTTTNIVRWVTVKPAPPNLVVEPGSDAVVLRGDFGLDQRYEVAVKAGFPSAEPFKLAQTYANVVTFAPVPPRLYFPAFSNPQLLRGQRRLDVLAINVEAVRVRARKLNRDNLIHALRGYEGYRKNWDASNRGLEPFREIDFNVVPGTMVYQRRIPVDSPMDQTTQLPLSWDDILGKNQPGAVFLVAEQAPGDSMDQRARLGTQALVQVTDLGVMLKRCRTETLAYIFSYSTGRAVEGATVRILTKENALLEQARTDASGIARFSKSYYDQWIMVESGADLYAERIGGNYLSPYGFNIPIDWYGEGGEKRQVLIFTDRDVYRPGETVYLKAIARDWVDNHLTNPPPLDGKLQVFDPEDNSVFTRDVRLSSCGSLSESFRVPEGKVGHYRATLELEKRAFTRYFQVREYETNPFEVRIQSRKSYAAGDKIELPVAAKYYMGKPLSKARLKWSLQACDEGFRPDGFEAYAFCSEIDYQLDRLGRATSSLALNGEGGLGAKGDFVVTAEIPVNPRAPQPRQCSLLVEITDLDQKTVSESIAFARQASDFYLGLRRFNNVVREGEPLPIELIAVQPDGTPWPQTVEATVKLTRVEWQTTRVKGAGGSINYRNDPILTPLGEVSAQTGKLVTHGTGYEVQPGKGPLPELRPGQAGLYLIEARAKDAQGREVTTTVSINVCGKETTSWNYTNAAQVELTPDKPGYREGDTATLLVKNPFDGIACVSIERENVLRWFTRKLSGKAPTIQIPLERGFAPNVFVSVVLIRGSRDSTHQFKQPDYRYGYCQLNVMKPESKLTVDLQPGAADYRPGQTVTLNGTVKDALGQSVPDAEVTLYAVDEGILSLTGYQTPDPYSFFHQIRPLGVNTILSITSLFSENPEEWNFANKGYLVGDGGEGALNKLRKNFLPCAFWNATLRTDAAGRLTASFTAPDSLTRYRVIAVAHTAQQQFGSGESKFEINKPLMLEPSLPRFANVGDQVLARAVIHNLTDQAGEVEVRLMLDDKAAAQAGGTESPGKMKQVLKLAARQTAAVDFPVEFRAAGTATWTWNARMLKAAGDRMTDAVETKLSVGYPVPLLREIFVARTQEAETNLLKEANPQLLEGHGTVTVGVANTRLSELNEAVSHLLHYPYGCVEQTTSSLLPWIVLKDLRNVFPELRQTPEQFDEAIQRGIRRLLTMQTESGGLSYWPGGQTPMLWASAYGGLGLALARQQGHPVPLASLDQLTKYLGEQLRNTAGLNDAYEITPRCLALYTLALAGKAEPSYHEILFQKREGLSAENRAVLALAILESKGDPKMVEELLTYRKSNPAEEDLWFGCGARELAARLLAWSRLRPTDRAVDVLVEELMRARRQGHWWTTQGNAWALMGLTEYARRVEGERKPAAGTLARGGVQKPFQVSAASATARSGFDISPESASLPLKLVNPQKALLFTNTRVEARPNTWLQPRQDRGFSISRDYARVEDDGSVKDLGAARVGDRVIITLQIETREAAHYVAIDDPLPSNFEALNPEFKTQATRAGENLSEEWFSDYRELRDDRAIFFRDHLPAGRYTIRYLARVRAVGTVTAPAAKMEEMYHPEHFGMSATGQVKTLALEP